MATKRQTRLQSRRQAEENAPPPPITTLLSQYELLTSLCQHLSSADIIHLGATSKEHWHYVTASPKLLKALIGNSSCDGRGIVAQARIFGYWDYKPERATRKCRGKDAQPCHDCGAMVCNVYSALLLLYCLIAANKKQLCRFHVEYPSSGPYSHQATATAIAESLDEEEQEVFDHEWDAQEQEVSGWFSDGSGPGSKVETIKSHYMLDSMKVVTHCEDCQPLIFCNDACDCTLHGLFSQIWRCIPCTLKKETKCATSEQKTQTLNMGTRSLKRVSNF
jgi:hypothetical protein